MSLCYRFDVLKWYVVCCLIRTQGCRKHNLNILFHTNALIPLKTSQQAHTRLVTTLDLCHSCINSASCQICVTSLLQFNKHDLCRHFTKPPSFSRNLCHTSVNTTDSQDTSLNTPDHVYFVHPSTDIPVNISTDSRLTYRSTYRSSIGRYVD